MNVVIDGRTATPHFPGIGRYVTNLVRNMAGEESGMSVSLIQDPSAGLHRAFKTIPCSLSPFSLSQQWVVPGLLKENGAAMYHSPYYLMPYRLPVPTVLTCYDLIPLIFPEYFTSWQRAAYRITNKLAFKAASRVIAISETTRRDASHFFGVKQDRIQAIPLGVESRFSASRGSEVDAVRAKYRLPDQYVLYVGTNKPHKNLVGLIEAWAIIHRKAALRHVLVIAGYWDRRYPEAIKLVEREELSGAVLFAGPVDDSDLPPLYTGASLFVFPSLYEGFGLPVLEAMACGTPVACSTTDALKEVAGNAASLFDPYDSTSMAACLMSLISDREMLQSLKESGLKRASMFSWEKTATETEAVYRAIT